MPRSRFLLLVLVLTAGCGHDREDRHAREMVGRALPDALGYPGSSLVSYAAGEDAAKIELSTPAPVKVVAEWYRQALPLNGWELQSDATDRNGAVTIYAEKKERPLWLTLRPNVGGPGTSYTLMGGIIEPDSSQAQRSGSSTSSKRIQRR